MLAKEFFFILISVIMLKKKVVFMTFTNNKHATSEGKSSSLQSFRFTSLRRAKLAPQRLFI